jgi:hypothetical protein
LRGLVVGQLSLGLIALAVVLVLATTLDVQGFLADGALAARSMLVFFVPYAALVLSAVGLYLTPSRILANVLVLGPFTLLRAPVLTAGVLAGIFTRPRWEIVVVLLVALASVGSLRPVLRRLTPPR